MSTKINARSPFYIEATEPTVSLGQFTCEKANLQDFKVQPDGTIINPRIDYGTIIDQSHDSFPALSSGDADVSRTVTYTIFIPDGYANTSEGTLDCDKTFTQVAPAAVCDSATNTNMATFSGTIGNITNLTTTTSQSVSLGSFFTQQAGATFNKYQVVQTGDAAIQFSLSGSGAAQTLTFTTASTGVTASFTVIAHNNGDSCTTTSNTFSVTAATTGDLVCTHSTRGVNLTGGKILQDGTLVRPSYDDGTIYKIFVGGTEYWTDASETNYPSNPNTDNRTVQLDIYLRIPTHYDNATPSGSTTLSDYLLCSKSVKQDGTTAPTLNCTDEALSYEGFSISNTGDILFSEAVVRVGTTTATIVSVTGSNGEIQFDPVTSTTNRVLDVTFVIPTGYQGASTNKLCEDAITVKQPPQDIIKTKCSDTTEHYITVGKATVGEFCDFGYIYSARKAIGVSSTNLIIGDTVCDNGSVFRGGYLFYNIRPSITSAAAGSIGGVVKYYQIDDLGNIISVVQRSCQSNSDFDEAL